MSLPTLMKPGRNGLPVGDQLNWSGVPAAVLFTIGLWLEHPRGAIFTLLGCLALGALVMLRRRDVGVYAMDDGVEVVDFLKTRRWRWREVAAFDYQRLNRGPGYRMHMGEVVLRNGKREALSSIVGTSGGRGVKDDQARERIRELNADLARSRPEPSAPPWLTPAI